MTIFFHILSKNIVPLFTIIALGFILDRKFNLNIFTLSKLNFYLFTPGFLLVNLYMTDLDFDIIKVLVFCIFYLVVNDFLGRIIAGIRGYDTALESIFKNSIMFNNSGNIGLSLITLVFGSAPYVIGGKTLYLNGALSVQIAILVVQNMTTNTVGFYNAGRGKMNVGDSIRKIFTMPSIYAIPIALLIKYLQVDITATPIWTTLVYIKDGLVPMALLTLGVQLSKTEFDFRNTDVYISVFTRLIAGPLLALGFIYLFGFTGVIAQTLFIAYSVPTAVNTALIAVEYNNNQSFAAQAVMMSTIFSTITLTLAIYAARALFPL